MSTSELRGWAQYLSMEPVNSTEVQLALLTTVVANILGGKSSIEDFLITSYKPPKSEELVFADEDAIANAFRLLASTQ